MTDIQAIQDFFTEDEWNAIFDALSEYQDHGDEEEQMVDSIQTKIHNLFS